MYSHFLFRKTNNVLLRSTYVQHNRNVLQLHFSPCSPFNSNVLQKTVKRNRNLRASFLKHIRKIIPYTREIAVMKCAYRIQLRVARTVTMFVINRFGDLLPPFALFFPKPYISHFFFHLMYFFLHFKVINNSFITYQNY